MQQAFVCSGYVMQQAFVCSGYVMQHTFIGLFSWITAMTIKITEENGKLNHFKNNKYFTLQESQRPPVFRMSKRYST
jgi:hypothetical protein